MAPAAQTLDRSLAFWGANMTRVREGGMKWPGFAYSDAEMARLQTLAAPIGFGAYWLFLGAASIIFILFAGIGIAVMFSILTRLYPDPSLTPASVFFGLLGSVALLAVGFGLPVAMRIAAGLVSGQVDFGSVAADAGDAALAAKVRWQIRRMTMIMCGIFVPGVLLVVTWDIDLGPLVSVLKGLAIGLMLLSMWGARRR